ncbi:hypothetical protein AB0L71_08670 [Streptomyces sp. NPDC052052]|uniref:hypothetical protein n=1 Tax=Streptomyces sp. NPDC052052 TaxID=3154756 RepID=UPI0034200900
MTDGQIVSERIAVVLTPAFGRAKAGRLLAEASAEASASGRSLGDVLGKNAEVAGRLSAQELAALVDPAHYTGAAGHLTDRAGSGGGRLRSVPPVLARGDGVSRREGRCRGGGSARGR